jgi:hypothetical protein
MEMESINISNAYLNGVLKDIDVYMRQPEGFESGSPGDVAHLDKGLYGLKQGGQCWFDKLDDELHALGFTCLQSDSSIFIWERDLCAFHSVSMHWTYLSALALLIAVLS